MTTGIASACPQCGAPLRFGGASSLAAVCGYCHSAVARAGADLSVAGKVPDLVATDTRLALGDRGKIPELSFFILGRVQLDQGAGVWNEWYVSFSDGNDGWLAEAMGRLFYTRRSANPPSPPPRFGSLHAGQSLIIRRNAAPFRVDEVGYATFISAEGELPFHPQLGQRYAFADATSSDGGFLTLDFGTGTDAPELFIGRELTYAEAGLADKAPPRVAGPEKARAVSCPSCGGPLQLKRTEAKSLTCPSCRSLLDVEQESLRVVQVLSERTAPAIPLGSRGTLRGEKVEVLGFLRRFNTVEGTDYEWREYLLHGPSGYRFLSEYQGHWLWLAPLPGGRVQEYQAGRAAVCDGRTFRHFQTASARFREVQGEFYWRVDVKEPVLGEDYVAPPYLLSCEHEAGSDEINWSRGEYLSGDELWKALSLPGRPPTAHGIAAAQPNPYASHLHEVWRAAAIAIAALFLLAAILYVSKSGTPLLTVGVQPSQSVALSEPFELNGSTRGLRLVASASGGAWVGVDAALMPEAGGPSQETAFKLDHGKSGFHLGEGVFPSVPSGRYLLRVEPRWAQDEQPSGPVEVRLYRGTFMPGVFLAALLALLLYPLWLVFKSSAFERGRWEESDHR